MLSPARRAAFDVLLRVERSDSFAADLLHSRQYANLSPSDHGLATELVMGVLRWRPALDGRIADVSLHPLVKLDLEVLTSLRMAVYQMDFLSRIPKHAAVHESVDLVKHAKKRSAVPFTNAILRKLSAKAKPKTGDIPHARDEDQLAAASAHPRWLIERWVKNFGIESARRISAHGQAIPETAIRLYGVNAERDLAQDSVELAAGRLLTSARRVKSGDVTKTAAFREGRLAIQDEASQLVALLVGKGERILDGCAAPGGKTRVLATQNPRAVLTAIELHAHRAGLLRRLVPEQNVEVVAADIREYKAAQPFDRVLADVPCSGTGTLARNPDIKWRLKPEDLLDLQKRQLGILRSAMKNVAPGGRLVYSTCSLEPEENNAVVEKALEGSSFHLVDCRKELERLQKAGELIVSDPDGLVAERHLRILPGRFGSDGFFAAILERE